MSETHSLSQPHIQRTCRPRLIDPCSLGTTAAKKGIWSIARICNGYVACILPASHYDVTDVLCLFHNLHTVPHNVAHLDTDLTSENWPWPADKTDLYRTCRHPSWYDSDVKKLALVTPRSPTDPALRDLFTLWLIWYKRVTTHPDRLHKATRSRNIISHPLMLS